jgi:hypothetical protein
MDLTDLNIVFHPPTTHYTFFSAVHGAFLKIDNILRHKESSKKYENTEIIPCIF